MQERQRKSLNLDAGAVEPASDPMGSSGAGGLFRVALN